MNVLSGLKKMRCWFLSKMPRRFIFFRVDLRFAIRNLRHAKSLKLKKASLRNVFVFIIDPRIKHPGLADRLKAIINAYNIAKYNKYQFKVIFDTPFELDRYLQPNMVDWKMKREELEMSLLDTKFYNEVSWRNNSRLKSGKQYHCYNYSGNLIPKIFSGTGYEWTVLFDELFKPSSLLQDEIDKTGLAKGSYISVHLRFVNALENFEQSSKHFQLQDSEKKKLIERCRNGIQKLVESKDEQVVVFSDSRVFLDAIQDMPVKTLSHQNIGHISQDGDSDHVLKTFLDLYVISRSKEVYSICAPELYEFSCFALCAARIGGVLYSRIIV